jgi:hypothetical protein
MVTGRGRLTLRDWRKIDVLCRSASAYDDRRVCYLLFDTTAYHDGLSCMRLTFEYDDRRALVLVVVDRSDRKLAVEGRLLTTTDAV